MASLRKFLAVLLALACLFTAQALQFALATEEEIPAGAAAVNAEPKPEATPKPAEAASADSKPAADPKPAETASGGEAPQQSAPAANPTPNEAGGTAAPETSAPETAAPTEGTAPTAGASTEPSQGPAPETSASAEPTPEASTSPEPSQEPTPETSASPEPSPTPLPLSAQLSAQSSYGFAHATAIYVQLRLSGGTAPYTVSVQGCEGGSVSESTHSAEAEGSYTYAYMPTRYGNCTVKVVVTDALGQTASDAVCVPVAAHDGSDGKEYLKRAAAVQRTGDWVADLLAVAASQIGYHESKIDYHIDADGKVQGHTIYGSWYGASYSEWCAMFVSWSMNQAGIPSSAFPYEAGCQKMVNLLADIGVYEDDEDSYEPRPGDVVFINLDAEGDPDHVGIVERVSDEKIFTIEGNSGKKVQRKSYARDDGRIMGYASMEKVMKRAGVSPTKEPEDEDATPAPKATATATPKTAPKATATATPKAAPKRAAVPPALKAVGAVMPVAVDEPKTIAEVVETAGPTLAPDPVAVDTPKVLEGDAANV